MLTRSICVIKFSGRTTIHLHFETQEMCSLAKQEVYWPTSWRVCNIPQRRLNNCMGDLEETKCLTWFPIPQWFFRWGRRYILPSWWPAHQPPMDIKPEAPRNFPHMTMRFHFWAPSQPKQSNCDAWSRILKQIPLNLFLKKIN